jgi:SAM-dependent methyltransferase
MLSEAAIGLVLEAYSHLGLLQRYHLKKRLGWCPYETIAALIPDKGIHLDIGCGYGHFLVYLAQTKPRLALLGYDPDQQKLAVAKTSSPVQAGRIKLLQTLADEGVPRHLTSISLIDVLYLMPPGSQRQLMEWISHRLPTEGLLIIKSVDVEQGFRSQLAAWQEFIMVKLLKQTLSSGSWTGGKPLASHVDELRSLDFGVRAERLRNTRTPSLLIRAKRSVATSGGKALKA